MRDNKMRYIVEKINNDVQCLLYVLAVSGDNFSYL